MHVRLKRLGALCAACMLMSCTSLEHPAPSLAPVAISADEAYLMGRQHQLARSGADAMRLYRQALAVDPRHVNARNGLASVLAEQGDFSAAIALWKDMTTAPGTGAYLFNNLGYAYFFSGQYALAQQAQERSCLLDPTSALAWQRLASTLDKLGDTGRAARLQRQAQSLMAHDAHADAALAGGSVTVTAGSPDDGWSQAELIQGADGLLTLSRTRAREVASTLAVSAARTASLEITNGNGVPGLARAAALRLRTAAVQIVRLSNEAGYGVRRTRVEYQPAFKALAERLADQVQPGVPVVASPKGARADIRLVLGHDAAPRGQGDQPISVADCCARRWYPATVK